MGRLVLVTAPVGEPIDATVAIEHLRENSTTAQVEVIDRQIAAARRWAEEKTGRALLTQTWDLFLDRFPSEFWPFDIRVPKPPLQSITTLKYTDENGTQQTLGSTLYTVDVSSTPGRIVPAFEETWPTTQGHINDVEIRFIAGYGANAEDVLEDIREAMLKRVNALYLHRESVVVGEGAAALVPFDGMQAAAEALISPYIVRTEFLA